MAEPRNKFAVGKQGDNVMVMFPVPQRLTKEDALNLAAWLVAQAAEDEEDETNWNMLLERIRNSE